MSVSFVIKLAKHKRHTDCTLISVACPDLQYFSTLSHKRHDFREKLLNKKLRVLIFYGFRVKHFSF